MQFIDLKRQQEGIRARLNQRIHAVLDHGQFIMGPEIGELEQRLADYVAVSHAVSCASGTDALLMALMRYEVGPGDLIFTSPFTFVATAEVIRLLGATPVFVDIDPSTYNLAPDQLEDALSRAGQGGDGRPRGIIAVDLFGLPADYPAIGAIAEQHGLFVIEDAAQSFGATLNGKRAGAFGQVGCTSFFPAKPLGGYGDGGMCFTDDADTAAVLRSIRIHGQGEHKYDNVRIGINGRMDTLQAAILLAKFDIFPEEVRLRQEVAARYTAMLQSLPGLTLPQVPPQASSVWAQYSVLASSGAHRETIQSALKRQGIPSAVYYPTPLHRQTAFRDLGYVEGAFPVSERCAQTIFSLPMHPYLTREDQERIADAIRLV